MTDRQETISTAGLLRKVAGCLDSGYFVIPKPNEGAGKDEWMATLRARADELEAAMKENDERRSPDGDGLGRTEPDTAVDSASVRASNTAGPAKSSGDTPAAKAERNSPKVGAGSNPADAHTTSPAGAEARVGDDPELAEPIICGSCHRAVGRQRPDGGIRVLKCQSCLKAEARVEALPLLESRLIVLASYSAKNMHANSVMAGAHDGHVDDGTILMGFDECPHPDCVLVRTRLAAGRPPQPERTVMPSASGNDGNDSTDTRSVAGGASDSTSDAPPPYPYEIKASRRVSTDEICLHVASVELRRQVLATETMLLSRAQAMRLAADIDELLAEPDPPQPRSEQEPT